MKTTIKLLDNTFTISATLKDQGVSFPNSSRNDDTYHNHFEVTVENDEHRVCFDYYGSHNDWENNKKKTLDKDDLINAFYCFLSDASCGEIDFEEFMHEFGYQDNPYAYKVYLACVDSQNDFQGFELDLHDLLNEIQEKYEL